MKRRNDKLEEEYSKKYQAMEDHLLTKKIEVQRNKVKVWRQKALNRGENDGGSNKQKRKNRVARKHGKSRKYQEGSRTSGSEDFDSPTGSEAERRRQRRKDKKPIKTDRTQARDDNGDLLDVETDGEKSEYDPKNGIEVTVYEVANFPMNTTVTKLIIELIDSDGTVMFGPFES